MSAVDINGTVLADGNTVLVLYGTIARIDTAVANRAYLALPDGHLLYVNTTQLEKVTGSISGEIAAAIPATSSDIAQSVLAPAVDESIAANFSGVIVRQYAVASGKKLTINSGARLRIL